MEKDKDNKEKTNSVVDQDIQNLAKFFSLLIEIDQKQKGKQSDRHN